MTTMDTVSGMTPELPLPAETDAEISALDSCSESTPVRETALDKVQTSGSVGDVVNRLEVLGSTNIYDEHGKIRLIPTPTPDPKDPLNLPNWRKYTAIGSLCLFGSLSLAADFVVAGLLPVFILEYSGVDPKPILKTADLKGDTSPLAIVPKGVKPVSLYAVTLLSTLPPLTNCVASYLLVPLSLAIGRRPVLLATALCSWAGGFWAGFSDSLQSHLMARVVHGLGSATVEGLLPLIMQDMVFIHQRNRAIAAILACQGPLMTVFGIISPYVAVNYSWRWLYWITAGAGALAWILLIFFLPETRKMRSREELAGVPLWPLEPGQDRTKLDYETYGRRTLKDNIGIFNMGFEWKETGIQMLRTIQSTYFPAILMVIAMDSAFFIVLVSVGQTISFALLAAGIPYELSGLHVITSVLSSVVVYVAGGPLADRLTLRISRLRGSSQREPEYQLPNLIFPFLCAMVGCAIFACAQHFRLHVAVLLTGTFFLSVGTMTAMTILKTFIIESYPQWPGPVLVNVSTYRTLISFGCSSQATTWVQEKGPLIIFGIYIAMLFAVSLLIPLFYFYGKRFRLWTGGRIREGPKKKSRSDASCTTSGADVGGLTKVMSSDTMATSEKGLIRVMSAETTSPGKSISKVTSMETVESIDQHVEGLKPKSAL